MGDIVDFSKLGKPQLPKRWIIKFDDDGVFLKQFIPETGYVEATPNEIEARSFTSMEECYKFWDQRIELKTGIIQPFRRFNCTFLEVDSVPD
jgi:hypothetical protein